ncbi:hypothetical protein BTM409_24950 [Helicobacter pylori]
MALGSFPTTLTNLLKNTNIKAIFSDRKYFKGLQRIATSLLRTHDENCNRLNGG